MLLHGAVARRRLQGKQRPEPYSTLAPGPAGVALAVAAENCAVLAADGLLPLPLDQRRRHVHWTQCRTLNPKDIQPCQLSREDFWKHLVKCYAEAYPKADSPTGSILQFGIVCKEKHKTAVRGEDRDEHHHAATFSSTVFYWKKVRDISANKYGIHLNAVAHDAYVTMFQYLRQASGKKPWCELDLAPYFSPEHPEGEALRELLEAGAKYLDVRAKKQPALPLEPVLRSQFGVVFNWVVDHNLHGPVGEAQLKEAAVRELKAGRPKLLDFVKKHRTCLLDQLDFIWELVGAKEQVQRLQKSRPELLLEAAVDSSRVCANGRGQCANVYESILSYQGIPSLPFRHSLFQTLRNGRQKGNAFMIVGGRDTGKTTITEPAAHIFKTMQTPQADSFCPLQDIRGYEVFLWHDFRYKPGHPHQAEQGLRLDEGTWNRLVEGLPTLIGVAKTDGSRADFVYKDDGAFICTGPFKLQGYKDGRVDQHETEQLDCRMKYVFFSREASANPDRSFKPCAQCWSRWLLAGAAEWHSSQGGGADAFMEKVRSTMQAPPPQAVPAEVSAGVSVAGEPAEQPAALGGAPSSSDRFAEMAQLMAWRREGLLTEGEFAIAKQRLLQ